MKSFRSRARRSDAGPDQLVRLFQSESAEIREAPEPKGVRATVYVLTAFMLSLVALAFVVRLDRVVYSAGQIVTTDATQVIQALDPSIIKTIDVREGQRVKAGEVLATLDPTFAAADVTALKSQVASLDAQIARCEAELANKPYQPVIAGDASAPQYAEMQKSYYLQRKAQFDAQAHAYDEQIAQLKTTVAKLSNDQVRYGDRARLAKEVEDMRATLAAAQVGSRLNLLAATDTKTELLRNAEFAHNSLVETQHQLESTISNRDAFVQQWLAQTSQELVTARNQRDTALQQLEKATKHKDLVRLEALEDSVVLKVSKLSVGSVLKEGDPLMYLAPLRSPMGAEVKIRTHDVGFIRPGDPVTVKLDTFNFIEHGTVEGTLRWVSEGAFTTDDNGNAAPDPYYKARVALTKVDLREVPDDFRLIPGMTLTGDIHIGTRSIMTYLVSGALRGIDEAMREP